MRPFFVVPDFPPVGHSPYFVQVAEQGQIEDLGITIMRFGSLVIGHLGEAEATATTLYKKAMFGD
jgi:hypothetical protein